MRYPTLFLITVLIFSCSVEPTTENHYKISGIVYQHDQPISDAQVELLKNENVIQTTSTDYNGYFELLNVPASDYTLVTNKSYENGSFVEMPVELNVNDTIYLDTLLLPDPVQLYPPSDITNKSVSLKWSAYQPENFYEYKIYRHSNTGLDETTATLIHIATGKEDTVFSDQGIELSNGLYPGTTYYYRVYVNNMYGRLGGSNIQKATTTKWANENNFTVFYHLREVTNFPGKGGSITGLDYDGESLWLVSVIEQGGYYDNDIVKLIRYNYTTDETISSFEYNDDYIKPRSLTWAENLIWIYYDDLTGPYIKKISPETGETVGEFSNGNTVEDMAADGEFLYLNLISNQIQKIRLNDLSLVKTLAVPFSEGTNSGIACREGEIWLTSRIDRQIIILDENGTHIGVVNSEVLSDWNGITALCFMGNNLVLEKDSRVYIFEIQT